MARRRSLEIVLVGDADQLERAFARGARSARQFERALKRTQGSLGGLVRAGSPADAMLRKQADSFRDWGRTAARAATVVGAGAAAAGAHVVKTGAQFEQEMSRVQAVSGATARQMGQLTDQANRLGAATKFSSAEAASGMYELASAGFTVEQMGKAIPGVLDLAASANIELADAAEISANALRGFRLPAADSARVADVLAEAINRSSLEASDLQNSLKYIAPIAATTGQSLETMTGALSVMADAGIKGEQAGTTLRAALVRLTRPTKMVRDGLDTLGLEIEDIQGPHGLLPLPEIIAKVDKASQGLDKATRNAALAQIFGTEALSGMVAVVDAGAPKLRSLTAAYEAADGAATRAARTMQDNVSGAWEELTGSIESAEIALYTRFQQPIKEVLRDATEEVNKASAAMQDFLDTVARDPRFRSGDLLDKIAVIREELERRGIPQKLADTLGEGMAKAADYAVPRIVEGMASGGMLVARGFVAGFLDADALTKLVIGGWLFAKLGGVAAIRATGARAGAQAGAAMATGAQAGAATAAAKGGVAAALFSGPAAMMVRDRARGLGLAAGTLVPAGMATKVAAGGSKITGGLAALARTVAPYAKAGVGFMLGSAVLDGVASGMQANRRSTEERITAALRDFASTASFGLFPSYDEEREQKLAEYAEAVELVFQKIQDGASKAELARQNLVLFQNTFNEGGDKAWGRHTDLLTRWNETINEFIERTDDQEIAAALDKLRDQLLASIPTHADFAQKGRDAVAGLEQGLNSKGQIRVSAINAMLGDLAQVPPRFRRTAALAAVAMAAELERQGRLPAGAAARVARAVNTEFLGMRRVSVREARLLARQAENALDRLAARKWSLNLARSVARDRKLTKREIDAIVAQIQRVPRSARREYGRAMLQATAVLARDGKLPRKEWRKIQDALIKAGIVTRRRTVAEAARMAGGTATQLNALVTAVNVGTGGMISQLNKALQALGVQQVKWAVKTFKPAAQAGLAIWKYTRGGGGGKATGGPLGHAHGGKVASNQRTGWIGRPGDAGRDTIPLRYGDEQVWVGSGELFLGREHGGPGIVTRHQLPWVRLGLSMGRTVDEGLARAHAIGLSPFTSIDDVWSRVTRPHYRAPGGSVTGDTDYRPELHRALMAMSRATGRPIYVQSGGRSLAEQAALYAAYRAGRGNLAAAPNPTAPHVRGIAADITPGREVFGGVAGRFGLGFTVPSESWHIELLNAAAAGAYGAEVQEIARKVLQGPAGALRSLGQGLLDKIHKGAQAKLEREQQAGMVGFGMSDTPVATGALSREQAWRILSQALKIAWPEAYSAGNVSALLGRAIQESGLNPNAVNNWDINARRGTPSIGLMQTIGPTFRTYALPGHGNIRNPLDNAIAAIRYMRARYGRIVGPGPDGYAVGGRLGPATPLTGIQVAGPNGRAKSALESRCGCPSCTPKRRAIGGRLRLATGGGLRSLSGGAVAARSTSTSSSPRRTAGRTIDLPDLFHPDLVKASLEHFSHFTASAIRRSIEATEAAIKRWEAKEGKEAKEKVEKLKDTMKALEAALPDIQERTLERYLRRPRKLAGLFRTLERAGDFSVDAVDSAMGETLQRIQRVIDRAGKRRGPRDKRVLATLQRSFDVLDRQLTRVSGARLDELTRDLRDQERIAEQRVGLKPERRKGETSRAFKERKEEWEARKEEIEKAGKEAKKLREKVREALEQYTEQVGQRVDELARQRERRGGALERRMRREGISEDSVQGLQMRILDNEDETRTVQKQLAERRSQLARARRLGDVQAAREAQRAIDELNDAWSEANTRRVEMVREMLATATEQFLSGLSTHLELTGNVEGLQALLEHMQKELFGEYLRAVAAQDWGKIGEVGQKLQDVRDRLNEMFTQRVEDWASAVETALSAQWAQLKLSGDLGAQKQWLEQTERAATERYQWAVATGDWAAIGEAAESLMQVREQLADVTNQIAEAFLTARQSQIDLATAQAEATGTLSDDIAAARAQLEFAHQILQGAQQLNDPAKTADAWRAFNEASARVRQLEKQRIDDRLELALAEASLTESLEDDRKVLKRIEKQRRRELEEARRLHAEGVISDRELKEAIEALKSATDQLGQTVEENTQANSEEADLLRQQVEELRRANAIMRINEGSAMGMVADVLSSQVIGRGVIGRSRLAGDGTVATA